MIRRFIKKIKGGDPAADKIVVREITPSGKPVEPTRKASTPKPKPKPKPSAPSAKEKSPRKAPEIEETRKPRPARKKTTAHSHAHGSSEAHGEPVVAKKDSRKKPDAAPKPKRERKEAIAPAVEPRHLEEWDASVFNVEPAEGKTRFHDLGLSEKIMHAIYDLGFEYCTPIQSGILPITMQGNKDACGRAQTGTGKTAAFLITILEHFLKNPVSGKRKAGTPRALIMAPTRELALQIEQDAIFLSKYIPCAVVAVFGGMDYNKQKTLLQDRVVDIIVATPGRLLDFKRGRDVNLGEVEILVIDEADRMLDMGFIPDMRKIIYSTPPETRRQTLLFSATLDRRVMMLAEQWMIDPDVVEIEPENTAAETVNQQAYIIMDQEKFPLLYNMITKKNLTSVMIFANRRDQTRKIAEKLSRHGISVGMLSGDVAQKKRIRILDDFKSGKLSVLVATDVAGRGIHIDGVSHVINYNLPDDPEDYVHRIGRTGRAGASGESIILAGEVDADQIPDIEKFIGRKLTYVHPDEELLAAPPAVSRQDATDQPWKDDEGDAPRRKPSGGNRNRRSGPGGGGGRKPRS